MHLPLSQPRLSLPADVSFAGRTVAITGVTAGIGLAAAQELVHRKVAHLIIGVRDTRKGNETRAALLAAAAAPLPTITVLEVDLLSYDSVKAFCAAVQESTTTLDTMILNAGYGSVDWSIAPTGHEARIQVNLLSNALMALSLVPLLRATAQQRGAPSRLVWIGSFTQFHAPLAKHPLKPVGHETVLAHFDNRSNDNSDRYAETKMLVSLYTRSLATRLNPAELLTCSVDPGLVRTNFASNYPGLLRVAINLYMRSAGRSPDEAALTYLHAAAVVGAEAHGKYLSDNKIKEMAPYAFSQEGQEMEKRMWDDIWEDLLAQDPSLASVFDA